jgi:hypothetical protein
MVEARFSIHEQNSISIPFHSSRLPGNMFFGTSLREDHGGGHTMARFVCGYSDLDKGRESFVGASTC